MILTLNGARRISGLGLALGAAVGLAVALAPAAASAAPLPADGVQPGGLGHFVPGSLHVGPGLTQRKSNNWSGYADEHTKGNTYTKVSGTWTQPKVKCTSATALAAFWVGIDGSEGSQTVQQDGTLAECTGGKATYYDWWEMYPTNAVQVEHPVSPGDKLTGSVVFTGKAYTLTVTDHTHKSGSFTTTQKCSGTACLNTSAEWIVERPSGSSGLYALADYGTATFTKASVTSGKTTGAISKFPDAAITMTAGGTGTGGTGPTLASVSKLASTGTSFTDTWHRMK